MYTKDQQDHPVEDQQTRPKKVALKQNQAPPSRDEPAGSEAEQVELVDGETLADSLAAYFERYLKLARAQVVAAVLWTLHTHSFAATDCTAYLFVTSAQKQSGKTRLQEALELVVHDPMRTSGISPAALYRSVEAREPTLLLEECDAIFGGRSSEPLRGLLDSGNRRGGSYTVNVPKGDSGWEAKQFSTFCPKCLGGIDSGKFPDTLLDRSVVLRLTRKKPEDRVEAFRHREAEQLAAPVRADAETWAEQNLDTLAAARPQPVQGLSDRADDAWESLLAIAEQIGGNWPEEARQAAVRLYQAEQAKEATPQVLLLGAIRSIAAEATSQKGGVAFTGRWFTKDLLAKLNSEAMGEDAPWREQKDRTTAHQLARLLRPFSIEPGTVRIGKMTGKGYKVEQFQDAWERYLPGEDEEVSV
jgi:hypothetical protein